MKSSHEDEPSCSPAGRREDFCAALPYLLAGVVAFACLWWAWSAFFDHDEIEHLHAAWLIAQGDLPYRDFLEQHHPLLWCVLLPLVRLFSSPHRLVFAARCVDLGLLGMLLAVLSCLLGRFVPRAPARWVLLLLVSSFLFTANSAEIRPDPLMNLLLFIGLLLWVLFLEEPRLSRAAIAGLFFGMAAAVLQKALVVAAVVLLATPMICLLRRSGRQRVRAILGGTGIALLAMAAVLGALAAWIASAGIWPDFFFWNYTFNRAFYLDAGIAEHFSAARTFGRSFLQDPALWIAGIAGSFLLARDLWRRRHSFEPADDVRLLLLLIAIAYSAFLAFNRFPFAQYLIVLMPLVALFAGRALAACEGRRWSWVVPLSAAAMVVEFATLVALFETNGEQRAIQERVLGETTPAEAIAVPPPQHPIFRRDSSYFWYGARLIGEISRRYCEDHPCPGDKVAADEARWKGAPPAFVFVDPKEPSTHPIRWEGRSAAYAPTDLPGLFRRR